MTIPKTKENNLLYRAQLVIKNSYLLDCFALVDDGIICIGHPT